MVLKDNRHLLAAMDIDARAIDKKALKRRAKDLESQNFAAAGARKAIEAAMAAMTASTVAATAISS